MIIIYFVWCDVSYDIQFFLSHGLKYKITLKLFTICLYAMKSWVASAIMAGARPSDSKIVAGAQGVDFLSVNRAAELLYCAKEVKQSCTSSLKAVMGGY